MDMGQYVKERLPAVIRGITEVVAQKVATPSKVEDPTPKFMEKRLAILSRYQEDLQEPEEALIVPAHTTPVTSECPYCKIEELAGMIRNHLLFVAQECDSDELGPATGGMIPKAKVTVEEFIRRCDSVEGESHVKLILQLAAMKGQELLPKLDWINNCDEAREAAAIADELWHRAAKATQMFYASDGKTPYA